MDITLQNDVLQGHFGKLTSTLHSTVNALAKKNARKRVASGAFGVSFVFCEPWLDPRLASTELSTCREVDE